MSRTPDRVGTELVKQKAGHGPQPLAFKMAIPTFDSAAQPIAALPLFFLMEAQSVRSNGHDSFSVNSDRLLRNSRPTKN